MNSFKLFWTLHKWTGIILAIVFATTAVTGFLLLIKKNSDWIQPPSQAAAEGSVEAFVSIDAALKACFAQNHEDFETADDIDRIDVRLDLRLYKVRSKHHHTEIQVDAITGEVLSIGTRRSDLIEQIHDGSFVGEWMHAWVMPVVAVALLFLVCSGVWLFIEPILRRRRRRKRQRAA